MSSSRVLRGESSQNVSALPWSVTRAAAGAPGRSLDTGPRTATPAGSDFQAELQQATAAGRTAGFQEGRAAAEQQLRAQVDAAVERLGRTVADLASHKGRLRREAERDVVMLAVEIARRLLHREISVDPDAMSGLVRSALDKIEAREIHRVRVHPGQVAAIQATLAGIGLPQRIEVISDPSLESGAAIFETANGAYDASITTQLAEIENGFAALLERRR